MDNQAYENLVFLHKTPFYIIIANASGEARKDNNQFISEVLLYHMAKQCFECIKAYHVRCSFNFFSR